MTDQSLKSRLNGLVGLFETAVLAARDEDGLETARVDFLGRKGRLAELMAELPKIPKEDRGDIGRIANAVKDALASRLEAKRAELVQAAKEQAQAAFDATLPGLVPHQGSKHPTTIVMEDIARIFAGLGYDVVSGPEVENDFHNFEALNMPPDHPARDMQDTLYVTDSILLRTHTSPLQIRTLKRVKPPTAAIAPGRVYRRDSDLTHTPMFHQIEGFLVDQDVSMADMRGALTLFLRRTFGEDVKVRFRPSFFPFTEPSAEVDISCVLCGGLGRTGGEGCRVCKGTGWVEILGCGMIDPEVFKAVDIDPEVWSGFAFGLGVERVAMLKYGVGDLRMFFENDQRFLKQFV